MTDQVEMYHYTESGLPDVWIEGLALQDDNEDETVVIPYIRNLHKLIAREIVQSDGALTGAELRYLRTEMGMTQAQLGQLVHRERLTVSRWEHGESEMDGAAEALVRIFAIRKLELDEADLAEISAKCQSVTTRKLPIRIDASDPANYRLAA